MLSWIAALAFSALPQESVEELKKEIERLRQENQDLQERSIDDARTIQRLKQAVKAIESQPASSAPSLPPPPVPQTIGPAAIVQGRITAVMAKENWILINLGKKDGVKPGWKFDINRMVYETPTGAPKPSRLGGGEFIKFMDKDAMSQVRITDGAIGEMKLDDEVVAVRNMAPLTPAETAAAKASEGPKPGVYKITGRTGTDKDGGGYVLTYGASHGARQTDIVFAYKDGKLKAKLRLDTVKDSFSVANILEQTAPIDDADQVYTKEIRKSITGRVSMVDDKRGIAVDVKAREGARIGQRFEVRRQGQKVGTIILADVQSWGAWARPDGETRLEQVQRNDFVEVLEEGP